MAENKIKRKLVWEETGVSEIIGTILMLTITVVLFSSIITFVGQMPAPQENFSVEVDCDIVPINETNWNNGVNFKILHQGGKKLDPMWINIYIAVNDTLLTYNLNDGLQDKNGDGWMGVGEYWSHPIYNVDPGNPPIFKDSTYSITIIHMEDNLLVWQETLFVDNNFYAPIIVDAWIDSDLATPEVNDPGPISYVDDFKVYVKIIDPEGIGGAEGLDVDNLWVNLSSIYGEDAPPRQLNDTVDVLDALNDDIYVAVCPAPTRDEADVGYHYFHFNATDNGGKKTERHILFPVGMIVGENPQIVVRGDNIRFSDEEPVNGDIITIAATIQNLGGGSAQVDVEFYDGVNGIYINTYHMLLHSMGERDAIVQWEATPGGNHTIFVTAEVNETYKAEHDVYDPNPDDNHNQTNISVMPRILLVDDDGHLNDLSEGDTVSYMRASLEAADFEYDFTTVGAGDGPGYDYGDYPLEDYDVVIWMCGYKTSKTLTFDPSTPDDERTDDIMNLQRYLKGNSTGGNGGSLWFISEGFWTEAGVYTDLYTEFADPYLHLPIKPYAEESLPSKLYGTPGHPVTEYYANKSVDTVERVSGTDLAWYWDAGYDDREALNHFNLNDNRNRTYAISYDSDEVAADPIVDSRILVQTFDFSRIRDTATQAQYTFKAIMWLGNISAKYTQDIAISEQTIEPKSVFYKQNVTVHFVVRNNGFETYDLSDNLWWLIRITDMDGNDLITPNMERIDYLGADVNNTLELSYSWTPTNIGYHRIIIKVDPDNHIEESNELNNEISSFLSSGGLFVQYRVLVVDDDSSVNNGGGLYNETLEVHDALTYLNATGQYRYENYTVMTGDDGPPDDPGHNGLGLSEYNAVIWVGGEALDPLTTNDMINITHYLELGGKFWFVGSGLWDADTTHVFGDFAYDYLKIDSVNANQGTAYNLWGRTDDAVSHGMDYECIPDANADILVPAPGGVGFTYQDNYSFNNQDDPTVEFNSVRFQGNPPSGTDIIYSSAVTAWNLSALDSNYSKAEFVFMMLRWFDKPESRIEARISNVDVYISEDHPQLGSGYVLRAAVQNTGGATGNVLVRFMDGNTQIGSDSISIAPGGKTTAEIIWVPLFAGQRTISVQVDPIAEVDEIFEWSNNNATKSTIVYFFWDDMESGTGKWSHSATALLINGEDALEYFHDTALDTNIISEWNETDTHNVTECTDLTFYHSHDTSYWFPEPEGNNTGGGGTRASGGDHTPNFVEIFHETFPSPSSPWNGLGQDNMGWVVAQGNGDNDVHVDDSDTADGIQPPSGGSHLRFNKADDGDAPPSQWDWAWIQIDLSGYTNCSLTYHWQDTRPKAGEGGRVDYSTDASSGADGTWNNVDIHLNQPGNIWSKETFIIPDTACVSTFSLRFSATSSHNLANFLFDDIMLFSNTRPDQPGFVSHGTSTMATGGVTADETPSLNWNYSDADGDPQQYFRVVVHDDATDNEVWNSGTVANSSWNVTVGMTLMNGNTYYWTVQVSDGYGWSEHGGGKGNWYFKINVSVNMPPAAPSNPYPADSQGGIPQQVVLMWECSDPDNDTLNYTLYLDEYNPPTSQVQNNIFTNSTVRTLNPDTIYYWRIVANDGRFNTSGPVWLFATTGEGGASIDWSSLGRTEETVNVNKSAVTETMDLRNLSSAKLTFWHKYNLVSGLNGGFLQVGYKDINENGADDWDWKYIMPSNAYTGNLDSSATVLDDFGTRIFWCWNGVSKQGTFGWDHVSVNLLNHVPEVYRDQVRVKFNYTQWDEGSGYGWYIDDVRVTVTRSNSVNPTSSTQDVWNYTNADSHSGDWSWSNVNPVIDPALGYGLVKPGIDNYLMTTPIDLTNAKNAYISAYVKFNLNYQSGAPPDGFRIEVTKDNGVTWEAINLGVRSAWNISGTGADADDDYDNDGRAYTGLSDSGDPVADGYWVGLDSLTRVNIDLSAFSGHAIQIRFRMATCGHDKYDHSNNDPIDGQGLDPGFGGFWVDDVIVYGETILT